MKIAIIGAGAMGGVWAARLSASGNEVALLDTSAAIVEAITNDGLIVENKSGSVETAPVRATSQPDQIGTVDLAFFFVKAHHTAAAAELAMPLVASSTTVVSLQNGWGNSDTLAKVYAPDQIAMGVTYHSATVRAPGRIAHTGVNKTFIGPYLETSGLDRASAVGALMNAAGIETTATPEVKTEVWKKLILNCATLPTSALTRLTSGELGQPGPLLDVLDTITAEAVNVARALGLDIDLNERVETIHNLLRNAGAGKSSMLQDIEAQRKTEIEVVNGAVAREAERVGVDVPANRVMLALIGGLERSWQQGQ